MENKVIFKEDTHEYFLNGKRLVGVSEVLQKSGLVDLSAIRPDVLEAARKFGTATHKATELWDKGTLDVSILSLPLVPRLEAWKNFRKDYKIGEFSCIEKLVYSAKWGYAGTLDRICEISGKLTLLDIKSGEYIDPSMEIQLAAYQIAFEELTGLRIKQRWIIQLSDNQYKIYPCKEIIELSKTVFLAALTLVKWRTNHGKCN